MRILFFNLGAIEFRIIEWGIDGFNSLFDNDIILWGPIPDEKFIYRNKDIPIIKVFETTSINAVFDKLPKGWYPDIVACETSVLNYIEDMYLCPVRTILFTRDTWAETIYNRKLVELFDFAHNATIDRALYNDLNVRLLPLSNSAVYIPGKDRDNSGFKEREIDVIAIANYNRAFYHDRYKTFYKLAVLNKAGLKIEYVTGIKYSEIFPYYQRSKIVVDWSHTLSNRSYEAVLGGCLLFCHKENKLTGEVWKPWEEYIPYDEDNVLELINYYINNPGLALQVINKAKEKIQDVSPGWGQVVWDNINLAMEADYSVSERIDYLKSLPATDLYSRMATPLLFNYNYNTTYPLNWKEVYFKRIDQALSVAGFEESKVAPLIEAARLAFLLKKPSLSLKYLEELQTILPDYAWIYYFHGRIFFEQGENEHALSSLERTTDCALSAPELLRKFVLPAIENGNTCDYRRITDYMWQSVFNHNNEFQVKAVLYLTSELKGDIYRRIGDPDRAVNAYLEAITYIPIPDCFYKLNPLLIKSNELKTLLYSTEKGIENSPYDTILILYRAYALIQLNQKRKAIEVLKDHKLALKSFVNVRKIIILRYLINLLLLFVFLGRQPDSKLIIEIIRVLRKKSGFIYLA